MGLSTLGTLPCIQKDGLVCSNTSRGHLCILSQNIYFPIASVVRDKSENHNDIYFMAFALKGKVLKVVIEIVISIRGHYAMQ